MSSSDLMLGKYRRLRVLDEVDTGEAHLADLLGAEGFEKRVVVWSVGGTRISSVDLIDAVTLEATRAAALSHANIAQVLDLGVVEGTCFVVTERAPGHTLEAVLRGRSEMPWPIAAHIACEVAGALSYAHGRRTPDGELLRLVHRRLCPARIALSAGGDVKLTGFGTSEAWMTLEEYGAPEEARGEPVDGRADVFALGVMLRKCVPSTGVPDPLRDLIDWAMQTYPEQRPTATELRQELTGILHTAARAVTPRQLSAVATPPSGPPATERSIGHAIERIERSLDAMVCGSVTSARTMLGLYERLGRLCVEARASERGAVRMTRAFDLADGLGHDDYASRFCTLRGQLLAQANRIDESRDWLERAAAFRG